MSCANLIQVRLKPLLMGQALPSFEHQCSLKGDEDQRHTMNMHQANEGHGSQIEIGKECPYRADSTFPSCRWYAAP
jgi:hypothetical protein